MKWSFVEGNFISVYVFTLLMLVHRFHSNQLYLPDLVYHLHRIGEDYDAKYVVVHQNNVENIYGTYSELLDILVDVVFYMKYEFV